MTDTAADRARLAEIREQTRTHAEVASVRQFFDLLRMAEDGIAAREALADALAKVDLAGAALVVEQGRSRSAREALARAERAEAERDTLRAEVASLKTLRVEIDQGVNGPATIKVWRDNVLRFNGVDYSALMEANDRRAEVTALRAAVARMRGAEAVEAVAQAYRAEYGQARDSLAAYTAWSVVAVRAIAALGAP
jgi:uncharacterized membrane protein